MTFGRRLLGALQALVVVAAFAVFFATWVLAPLTVFAVAALCFAAGAVRHALVRRLHLRRQPNPPESDARGA
jgi:hypothetical protein